MDFTVIVVTYNRADVLRDTLAALSRVSYDGGWQVLVVDNNSTDRTREVVEALRRDFPVDLQYRFVPEPGKYGALNEGILAAGGRFIAATDDDAYPEPDWLTEAARGFAGYACDFVGGPVHPVWRSDPPDWLNPRDAISGKVLGLQDHGATPLEYGAGISSWPLGVNVAYRRDAFERAGMFDARLGRVAGTAQEPGAARVAPSCAGRRAARDVPAVDGGAPQRRNVTFDAAVLPAMVLLARCQPRDPQSHGGAAPDGSGGAHRARL